MGPIASRGRSYKGPIAFRRRSEPLLPVFLRKHIAISDFPGGPDPLPLWILPCSQLPLRLALLKLRTSGSLFCSSFHKAFTPRSKLQPGIKHHNKRDVLPRSTLKWSILLSVYLLKNQNC